MHPFALLEASVEQGCITTLIGPGGGSSSIVALAENLVFPNGHATTDEVIAGLALPGFLQELPALELGAESGGGILSLELLGDGGTDGESFAIASTVGFGFNAGVAFDGLPHLYRLTWSPAGSHFTGLDIADGNGGSDPIVGPLTIRFFLFAGTDVNGDGTLYSDITVERFRAAFLNI